MNYKLKTDLQCCTVGKGLMDCMNIFYPGNKARECRVGETVMCTQRSRAVGLRAAGVGVAGPK